MKKQSLCAFVSRFMLCIIAVFGMLSLQQAVAQSNGGGNLQGTVVDESGLPVIGASVVVKGTLRGVTSDLDGKFSLTDLKVGDVIEVSYIGYTDQEIAYNNQSEIKVVLVESATQMDALVVTALGIKKEAKSISYHVQSIDTDGVVNPSGSFVNSLTGKVAGVTINASSAGVGGSNRVVMRGTKSLNGNNNALYVIDGIPMPALTSEQPEGDFAGAGQTGDGLASLNPDDIENISVLSGPSAAALYGSSAANGVVMITTKKGSADRLSVSYSNSTTFSRPYIMPRFQNTYGHTETGSYQSWGDKLAKASSYDPRNFFQTGYNETNAVSISSGNAKNQTYFSAAATNAAGIIHSNDYDRYNFTGRNTTNFLNDKMTLDVNFMYSNIREQNMISQGEYMNPVVPVYLFPASDNFERLQIYERYDASRNMKLQYWPYDNDYTMQNPYWVTERNKLVNHKERFMASAQLKYEIADWINISGRAKVDKSNETFERKYSAGSLTLFAGNYGYYNKNEVGTRQIYAEALLNINKYFDHNFSLTATLGTSLEDVDYTQSMYGGKLASVANLFTFDNVDVSQQDRSQSAYHKQKQAIFLNAQVGWKGAIYLDVTGRNDWSSTLAGSKIKSFFYPTVGLSGIITEFINGPKKIVSYWKVRVSYSEVGNEPEPFLTIPTYSLSGGSPSTMTRMPNTDLQPERTRSWEVGTNLYMFRNKLKIDATYYKSSTYNQFFTPTLSASSGYSSVVVNSGQVDNQGVEVMARYSDEYAAGKVHFSTYLTWSLNRNKIVKLLGNWVTPDGEVVTMDEIHMGGMSGIRTTLREGGTMGDLYVRGLRTDEHGAIYVHPNSQSVVVETNNFVYAGQTTPKYNMGWGGDLAWKGISLNFLFTARVGGVVVSPTQAVMDFYGSSWATADARDKGGALVNGRRIPAQDYYQTVGGKSGAMSQYVYSATNIRLSELTIGYDFPVQKWCNWLKGLNVSFVGRNLWMIYKKAPFDPELTANTGTYNQGVDYFMQPSTRNLGFSVKVKF